MDPRLNAPGVQLIYDTLHAAGFRIVEDWSVWTPTQLIYAEFIKLQPHLHMHKRWFGLHLPAAFPDAVPITRRHHKRRMRGWALLQHPDPEIMGVLPEELREERKAEDTGTPQLGHRWT